MLQRCDAALIIGDPALFLDHDDAERDKIDLGEEWTAHDRAAVRLGVLGRPAGALSQRGDVTALTAARDARRRRIGQDRGRLLRRRTRAALGQRLSEG